jgi:hypothetical protein
VTDREQALINYFATIAFDPKVKASKDLDGLFRAIVACIKEDLPSVGRHMATNAPRAILSRVAKPPLPSPVDQIVGNLLQALGEALSNRKK